MCFLPVRRVEGVFHRLKPAAEKQFELWTQHWGLDPPSVSHQKQSHNPKAEADSCVRMPGLSANKCPALTCTLCEKQSGECSPNCEMLRMIAWESEEERCVCVETTVDVLADSKQPSRLPAPAGLSAVCLHWESVQTAHVCLKRAPLFYWKKK